METLLRQLLSVMIRVAHLVTNTGLGLPYGIALDSSGNIYVVNSIGGVDSFGSVTVYPPLGSSTGILNEAPSSTIGGDSINADITGFSNPIGIALDSSANIYVSNDGSSVGGADSITVYPAGSNGNVAPSATITGLSTGLGLPQGIAIGSRGSLGPAKLLKHKHKHKHKRPKR